MVLEWGVGGGGGGQSPPGHWTKMKESYSLVIMCNCCFLITIQQLGSLAYFECCCTIKNNTN